MIIRIDFQSDVPIYLQIRSAVIQAIASHELRPGEMMPSIRQMASDLGINLHTVNKAYNLLKQDGFVQVHRQKGVVVQTNIIPYSDEKFQKTLKESLRPFIAEAVCRNMEEKDFIKICHEIFQDYQKESSKLN